MSEDKYGLPTSYDSPLLKDYLATQKALVGAQKSSARDSLDAERSMMYDTIGRAQLQNERDILSRRTQAQRSGMSSSTLAAYEVQNINAGQMGIETMVKEMMLKEQESDALFAGAEEQGKLDVFELLNSNIGNIAAIDAQKYSASAITQAQELFPDATQAQQLTMSRLINGADLDDEDLDSLVAVTNPEIFTGTRLEKGEWKTQVKETTSLSWKEYKRLYDKMHSSGNE